ncbi:rab-GTPase-TBC domain-containing protein [Pilobolus umbonatus]|nr:rab-GTPase-TBC domain-containing protein [Pilobolus umbonatus]
MNVSSPGNHSPKVDTSEKNKDKYRSGNGGRMMKQDDMTSTPSSVSTEETVALNKANITDVTPHTTASPYYSPSTDIRVHQEDGWQFNAAPIPIKQENKTPDILAENDHPTSKYYGFLLPTFKQPEKPLDTPFQRKAKETLALAIVKPNGDDIDSEFWSLLISDFDATVKANRKKLKELIRTGVPSSLRGLLWQLFSIGRYNSDWMEEEYKRLLNQHSPHEKLIRKDLSRTFPNVDYFRNIKGEGQEMLFNVIKAYSIYDDYVGYCQGLHFIVGCLLLHMPDEEAFCVLLCLMKDFGLRGHYTPHMETLHQRLYQMDKLLSIHLPEIYRHLNKHDIRASMYASQWFITLFAYRYPLEFVFRVFDMIFIEGSTILLNIALAIMRKNEPIILSLDFESLIKFLTNNIFDMYEGDASTFVKEVYQVVISPQTLLKLTKQYSKEASEKSKMQSMEEDTRRINLELQNRLKALKESYDKLEIEQEDIEQQVVDAKQSLALLKEERESLRKEVQAKKDQIKEVKQHTGSDKDKFEALAMENANLVNKNSVLEERLEVMENVLTKYKRKVEDGTS